MLELLYPWEYVENVFVIDYRKLYKAGYRAIVFDIDNTLVYHGEGSTEKVDELFRQIQNLGLKTLLLTNNDEPRVKRFIKHIDTYYICDANKPDTDGYERAVQLLELRKEEVVCVGDQLFTDILGANKYGMANILVKYICIDKNAPIGKKRQLEKEILKLYRRNMKYQYRLGNISLNKIQKKERKNFCDINPTCYKISVQKEIIKRHIKNFRDKTVFTKIKSGKLPKVIATYSSTLIKTGKGIDPVLQRNKAINIELACKRISGVVIRPGEEFSFWNVVGRISKRKGYKEGRVIISHKILPGIGGGLCNLANTIHNLVLLSDLDVTEFHSHSDALAPDHGKRIAFSAGTSINYNYIDYRFKNNTDKNYQLILWCADGKLYGELRSEQELSSRYYLKEENHHFHKEDDKYYRISQIYKIKEDKDTGVEIGRELILNNHSEVMYDYDLIPSNLIQ